MANLIDKNKLKKLLKNTRIIVLILFFLFFAWLFYKNYAPTGSLVLNYNFDKKSEFIKFERGIDNPEKSISGNIAYSRITENPAEFSLKLPRIFKEVELEMNYISTYPLLSLSSKKKNSNNYVSKLLNMDLSKNEDWRRLEDKEKNIVLYQHYKDKEYIVDGETYVKPKPQFSYNKIDKFLNDLDNIIEKKEKKIAYFNYDLADKIKIEGYEPAKNNTVFDKTIRGKHKIVVYLGENEDLDFKFYYQDYNRYDGPDRFNVLIDRGNDTIARYTEDDDGDDLASGKMSELKNVHISRDNLESGIYFISLDISGDLYVHKIESKQKYFGFLNNLFLENVQQEDTTLYANSQNINAKTLHDQGIQTLHSENQLKYDELYYSQYSDYDEEEINEKLESISNNAVNEVSIEELDKFYNLDLSGKINKINISENDIVLDYKGILGMDPEVVYQLSVLEENIYPLMSVANFESVDYIITDFFQEAKKEGPFKVVKQSFNLDELEINKKNEVSFSLNIPNYNRNIEDLKLAEIKFTLKKDPWNYKFFKDKIRGVIN